MVPSGAFDPRHRLRPPFVLPLGEQAAQLGQHAVGEQLGVVGRQVFAHAAELHQQHQVADIEVGRQLGQLLDDFLG